MRAPLWPAPDAATARATSGRDGSPWFRRLDGTWRFALAELARRRARGLRAAGVRRRRVGEGGGPGLLDDAAGRSGRPPHLHERDDAVPSAPAVRARGQSDRFVPLPLSRCPARLAGPARRVARGRRRERAVRLGERTRGRHEQGQPARGRVRRHRTRGVGPAQHAARDGGPLVGRELRGRPGPVVAGRASTARSVLYSTAPTYLADVQAIGGLADDLRTGTLDVRVEVGWSPATAATPRPDAHVRGCSSRTLGGRTRRHASWSGDVPWRSAGPTTSKVTSCAAASTCPTWNAWTHETPTLYRVVVTLLDPSGAVSRGRGRAGSASAGSRFAARSSC